jgi:PAS domain S-box-containing protein
MAFSNASAEMAALAITDNHERFERIESTLTQSARASVSARRADSLDAALSLLFEKSFSCALLDLDMGGNRGIDSLVKIRTAYPDLPVIVLSAREEESLALACIRAGAQDFLNFGEAGESRLTKAVLYAIERIGIQKELRENEERHRAIFEAMEDAVYICDPDGKVEYMNPAAILRNKRNAVGEPCHQTLHSLMEECPWCPREVLRHGGSHAREIRSPRDNRLYHISWSPLRREDGRKSVMAIFRDITSVRQTEEAVTRFGRIIDESLEEVHVFHGATMRYQQTNQTARRNLGYSQEELREMTPLDIIPHDFREQFGEMLDGLRRKKYPRVTFTTELLRRNSTRYPVEMHMQLLSQDNELTFVAFAMDIGERQKIERERERLAEQIQKAQRLDSLSTLAGGIAHHFNNLLMTILGNAELAQQEMPPDSPLAHCLSEIEKAGTRAAGLSTQMLTFSGHGKFRVQRVDLSQIIQTMQKLLEVSVPRKIEINYELAPDLPSMGADIPQMQQVIMNLITNAVEAMGNEEGRITLRTGTMECGADYLNETLPDWKLRPGLFVFLAITDPGCGMDRETIERIFDPFFSTKFTGRGLGLAAALGIVRGHGGTINVHSEKGKGTTFTVLFPVRERRTEARRGASVESRLHDGEAILLVEDEQSVRTVTARILERAGYRVETAVDGVEALQILEENIRAGESARPFDCVILDLTMPRMDGMETYRRMLGVAPGVPIIISSGYNEDDVLERFPDNPPEFTIQKPYQSRQLLDMTLKAVESRKQRE